MTKDALWHLYCIRNPLLTSDDAHLSPAGVKKLFDTTWDAAYRTGMAEGMEIGAREERERNTGLSTLARMFGGMG